MSEYQKSANGRVALVTGAAGRRGVAAGVCAALAESGWQLVINDVDEELVRSVASAYPGALGIVADIRDEHAVEHLFDRAYEHFGRVDAVVNNAGVGLDRASHLAETADFDRIFSINVRGLWLVTRAFVRRCVASAASGTVVNVSSVHAQHTQSGYAMYAGSKGAVEGLTRGFAAEFGPLGVRCNAVAPGAVLDVAHAGEYGLPGPDPVVWIREHARIQQSLPHEVTPLDVGRVIEFLASDRSRSMTGQIVTVDAGLATLLYDRRSSGHEV